MATELEQLKAERAALGDRIRRLEGKAPPKPAPVEPEGTTLRYPAPTSKFVMPNDDELGRLRAIVTAKIPRLALADGLISRGDKKTTLSISGSSLRRSGLSERCIRKNRMPDRKHYLHHWTDHCETWLKTFGQWIDLSFAPLSARAWAHGDVAYSGLFVDGEVLELGLNAYGIGRPAGDAWRRVLETGEIVLPSPPAMRLARRRRAASISTTFGEFKKSAFFMRREWPSDGTSEQRECAIKSSFPGSRPIGRSRP